MLRLIISIKNFIDIARILSWRLYTDLAQLIRNMHAKHTGISGRYLERGDYMSCPSTFPGASSTWIALSRKPT